MSSKDIYHGPKVKDTQSFIEKAQFVHGDTYGYDNAEYVNARTKITITCPIHGDFEQRSDAHLSGQGCASCKFDSKRSDTETFVQKAKSVHGDTYGYDKAKYTRAHSKITITCKKHGDFQQAPAYHLSGQGCPECAYESLSGGYTNNKEEYKQKSAIFYHVRFSVKNTDEAFEKFGITVKSVKDRFNQITNNHNLKLEVINEYQTTLYEAIELEQEIKEYLLDNNLAYRVQTLKQYPRVGGWTECFRCGDLDSIF